MVRSQRTNFIGRILQTIGRALQSNPSKPRKGARRSGTRTTRRRRPTSGKGLLRRLLS